MNPYVIQVSTTLLDNFLLLVLRAKDGVAVDPIKVESVMEWQQPTTPTEV